jgi:hypothetical protein
MLVPWLQRNLVVAAPEPTITPGPLVTRELYAAPEAQEYIYGLTCAEVEYGACVEYGAKEGGSMMPTEVIPTETAMRAGAGFTFPPELKSILPLLLIFGIVVLILIKK